MALPQLVAGCWTGFEHGRWGASPCSSVPATSLAQASVLTTGVARTAIGVSSAAQSEWMSIT
jgi:hypothetical protein